MLGVPAGVLIGFKFRFTTWCRICYFVSDSRSGPDSGLQRLLGHQDYITDFGV